VSRESERQLRDLVAQLQDENSGLRAASGLESATTEVIVPPPLRRGGRWRAPLSVVLIVLGAVLAPVALAANWAKLELSDTELFVSTFAPLADDPAVQDFVSAQVVTVINDQVDIAGVTSDLVDGISQLGLGPRAQAALELLKGPASDGIKSLIGNAVSGFVESPQFSSLWQQLLRTSHDQLIATMQGDPDAVVTAGADGTIGIQLGPVVAAVKERLVDQGIGLAANIPEVDRTITIAESDAVPRIQTAYALVTALGAWLPWIVLVLLAGGVVVARRRVRTLIWAAVALALAMLLSLAAIAIAKPILVGMLAPKVMTSGAANAALDQVTGFLVSSGTAVTVLALTVAIVGWIAGPFSLPRRLRGFGNSVLASARAAGERHNLSTGRTGRWLYRQRTVITWLIALAASALVLFVRPLSAPLIVWTAIVAIVLVLLLHLASRPPVVEVEAEPELEAEAPALTP
jgi:hypothetical protein